MREMDFETIVFEEVEYRVGIDNIFDFNFMDDFSTIAIAREEYNIDISNLEYQSEDDFYCFTEHKVYNEKELFEKFNVKKIV